MPNARDRLAALWGATSPTDAATPERATIRAASIVAIVVVLAVSGFAAWAQRPMATVKIATPPVAISPIAASNSDDIVVDVEGDVREPGLVHLSLGSRVADAVAAAGGVTSEIAPGALNLAARLDDGQLLVVGQQAAASGDTRVSLNQGAAADFDSLPGVGPVLAGRIIAWREAHHRFTSIDQLQDVPGIGAKVFDNLKTLVKL
jgi:competence protein ComEA